MKKMNNIDLISIELSNSVTFYDIDITETIET